MPRIARHTIEERSLNHICPGKKNDEDLHPGAVISGAGRR